MKINQTAKYCGLALAAFLASGASPGFAQTANLVINSFDTGTQGTQPNGCGIEWGTGNGAWDGTQDDTANSGGSLLATTQFNTSSDTPFNEYICLNGGNWYYEPTPINFSQYKSIDFDIKWDNTSDMTIGQYNDPSTFPPNLLQSWAPTNYLAGSVIGFDVIAVGPSGNDATIATIPVPTTASNGWTHVSIPISASMSGIDGCSGFVLHKWVNQVWGVASSNPTARFWIDNVTLIGTAGPPPPPTISPLTKPVQGLNVFASTAGVNDREEVTLVASNGLSWVGHTGSGPVTYSFTISSFPKVPAYTTEAYLFLVPNPGARESAADYNETNVAWLEIQSTPTGGQGIFQYKVDDHSDNKMLYGNAPYTNAPGSWPGTPALTNWFETGNLTNVQSTQLLGTWTLKFTSDQNGTIIAPDGTTASFTIPSYYYTNFAETTGFNIYLGMQANTAANANQAVVYSDFSVQGVASPYSENFVGETALNTNFWVNTYAAGPAGVLIVPPGSAYWIQWTLPDSGFGLEQTGALPSSWHPVTTGAVIPGAGMRQHLLSAASLPAGNSAFFHLIKRSFSQLLVLLPGQTNTPGVAPGYSGTTPALSLGGNPYVQEVVTVMAVDSQWNPVSGITDAVAIVAGTGSDSGELLPTAQSLVNGTTTFGNSNPFFFADQGTWTITVTDQSSTNIAAAVSSPVTVNP